MIAAFHARPYRFLPGLAVVALLAACGARDTDPPAAADLDEAAPAAAGQESAAAAQALAPGQRLAAILAMQSEESKARYAARHPAETLAFFGIEAGMTVVETDPGSGWYSRILLPLLGDGGTLIGADYPMGVYQLFDYYSADELADKATWPERWPGQISDGLEATASVKAYRIGEMPAALDGAVDAVLFVRVLHNLADFEDEGGYLSAALDEAYRVLKPGGIVGVVQHQGPETHSDEWASGANGYLKKSFVIARFEAAGFALDGESAVNENPLDRPTEDESVWRLPPTLEASGDPQRTEAYAAIGESNRMTLRFRKRAGR